MLYKGIDLSDYKRVEPEIDPDEIDPDDLEDEQDDYEGLPQPDLSVAARNPEYDRAIRELAELCGSSPVDMYDTPGWVCVHVNSKRRGDINTEELQRRFLERGFFVYELGRNFGTGPEKLCILPTGDKYDAIALHQTNGCNYGIGPGNVVRWLKELEVEQPFVLTCVAHDTLAGRFLTPVREPQRLAQRMYEFCCDIVDQGCGSVDILAERLASDDTLYFWWD